MSIGPAELLVVFIIALVVLGPKRLPEAARQLGKAMSEFKKFSADMSNEFRDSLEPDPPVAPIDLEAKSSAETDTQKAE